VLSLRRSGLQNIREEEGGGDILPAVPEAGGNDYNTVANREIEGRRVMFISLFLFFYFYEFHEVSYHLYHRLKNKKVLEKRKRKEV